MSTQRAQLHADAGLIDALGGPAELARRLGFKSTGGTQRVQNWKTRGIPAAIRLQHQDVFASAASIDDAATESRAA